MNEIVIPNLEDYPQELENSWIHIYKVEDHFDISYIVSFYNNDDYPRGTIIVSPFLYHIYPDSYVIFNKDNLSTRIYTNPVYRGRGYWKWIPQVLRCFFYNNFDNIYLDSSPERSMAGEKAYKKAIEIMKQKKIYVNNGRMKLGELEPPRDPSFPYIWYNNRIGGLT